MTSPTDHVLQMVQEYGALIRQECGFRALCSDNDPLGSAQHRENAGHARDRQAEYYAEIRSVLVSLTTPEPPEPDPIVMPPTVAARITNVLKGLRHV